MKVLFLDMDGVANSDRFFKEGRGSYDRSDWIHMIDPVAAERLAAVVRRTGAKLVISSSWRVIQDRAAMQDLLDRRGVGGEVLGLTPHTGHAYRGREIAQWLAENPGVTRFAIVDDSGDLHPFKSHFVQTTWAEGLLDAHVERLCDLLGEGHPEEGEKEESVDV